MLFVVYFKCRGQYSIITPQIAWTLNAVHARCDDLTESEVSREQPAVLYGRQVDNCWSSCSKAAERSEAPRNASTTPGCRQLELSPALTPGYGSEPASERVIRLNSQVARAPRIIRRRRDATSRRVARLGIRSTAWE